MKSLFKKNTVLIWGLVLVLIVMISLKFSLTGFVVNPPLTPTAGSCLNLSDPTEWGGTDGNEYQLNESQILCLGTYLMNDTDGDGAIIMNANNTTLDCNGATIVSDLTNFKRNGISIYNHSNITVKGCTLVDFNSQSGLSASILAQLANNTTILNNTISNTGKGILLIKSNYTIVKNNTILNSNETGIKIDAGQEYASLNNRTTVENLIEDNIIVYAETGIYVDLPAGWINQFAHNTTIRNNTINNTTSVGIRVDITGLHTVIYNNTVTDSTFAGIYVGQTDNVTIYNNAILRSREGILLYEGKNITIYTNNISSNNLVGINITSTSTNNLVYNNYFSGNAMGAWDDTAGSSWNLSKTAGTNIIGGPYLGGNYWDDYTGHDINEDTFGDTGLPYDSGGNIATGGDYLPLVSACVNLSGLNEYQLNESRSVCPGTYLMNDTDLDGAIIINADNLVLDCNGASIIGNASAGSWIGINATKHTNITIRGCTVSNYTYNIYFKSGTNHSTLTNNTVLNSSSIGIYIDELSTNNTISYNTVSNATTAGILLGTSANNNTVTANILNDNRQDSIQLHDSNNTIITSNNITNTNRFGVYGINSPDTVILNNILNNATSDAIRMITSSHRLNITNNTIVKSGQHGIYLVGDNGTISRNTVINSTDVSIYIYNSQRNSIDNNTVINNSYGIKIFVSGGGGGPLLSYNNATNNNISNCSTECITLDREQYSYVTGNYITQSYMGIYLLNAARNNTIANNTIYNATLAGVYIAASNNNTLRNNTIWEGDLGIVLVGSDKNYVADNNVHNQTVGTYKIGIVLSSSSLNNTITGNNVSGNANAGINLTADSENNAIYNNYFANNGVVGVTRRHAYDPSLSTNFWNTSKTSGTNIMGGPYLGGNYWDDYNGTDTDSDGIGDTLAPYNASGNISSEGDYLPLVTYSEQPQLASPPPQQSDDGGGTSDSIPPTYYVTTDPQITAPTFNVKVLYLDTIPREVRLLIRDLPAGISYSAIPSSLTLQPGTTGTFTIVLSSFDLLAPGNYSITVSATDFQNNIVASNSTIIIIKAPEEPIVIKVPEEPIIIKAPEKPKLEVESEPTIILDAIPLKVLIPALLIAFSAVIWLYFKLHFKK